MLFAKRSSAATRLAWILCLCVLPPLCQAENKSLSDIFQLLDTKVPLEEQLGTPEWEKKNATLLKDFPALARKHRIKVALLPVYDLADRFSEGLAAVSFGRPKASDSDKAKPAWKTGYIDKTGKLVIAPYFDGGDPFSDGMARVRFFDSDKVTEIHIDKSGKELFRQEYATIKSADGKGTGLYVDTHGFSDGLKGVYRYEENSYKFGYVDKTGKLVLPYDYQYAQPFREGLAGVGKIVQVNGTEKVQYGFMNKAGNIVIDYQFDGVGSFSHGMAPYVACGTSDVTPCAGTAAFDGQYGVINMKGEKVTPPVFLNAPRFSEGLASVCLGEYLSREEANCGVIDASGAFKVAPVFHPPFGVADDIGILKFSEGLAKYAETIDGDVKYGFIDKQGVTVIKPQYEWVGEFSEGLAVYAPYLGANKHGKKYGFIDKRGNVVIPAIFEDARAFSEGYAQIRVGNKWGYIRHP